MEQQGDRPTRIMLVDDHASFRQALGFLFNRENEFEVVAQVGTLAEARRVLEEQDGSEGIDAAVVDLGLPDGNGAGFIENLRRRNSSATALVLSATLSPQNFARALEAGASGVLDKLAGLEEIIAAVKLHGAGVALPSQREVVDLLRLYAQRQDESEQARADMELFTSGEKEILQALAEGLGSGEIASRLRISTEEERGRVASILGKLGARSRFQVLAIAARRGIVEFG